MDDEVLERLAALEALFQERTHHINLRLNDLSKKINELDAKLIDLDKKIFWTNSLSKKERYSLYGAIITSLISAIVSLLNTAIIHGLL